MTYDPIGECLCRASGVQGMVWPATKCGEVQTIPCFEGAANGMISRQCNADGEWEEFIQGNCTCTGVEAFETMWPTTAAGESAHVSCANDVTKSRDRLCLPNGEWDDVMTGGCSCTAEEYLGVAWEETEGGKTAEHVCNVDSEGSAYRRVCKKDGSWDSEISGGCTCPTVTMNGIEWLAAAPMQTQEVTCDAGSVSSVMSRTCGRYGSWYPIQGSCDCPEEAMNGMVWPQTAPGIVASIRCVAGAVGTPSTRACSSTGTWGAVTEGACSCPADAWTNYAGTQYAFPQTEAGAVATLPCVSGEGSITRACQQYGQWSAPEGCYEPVYCPAETIGELHFEATLGGTTAMFMCHQSSMSYGRVCKENGEWESVMGYCLCPAEKDEFNTEWAALRSGREVTMACGEGYSGELTRQCSFFGDWVKVSGECVRNRCPAEEQSAVMWPATDSMETATASCVSGLGAGFARVCGADGVWGEVTGECSCPATTIDEVEYPASAAGTVFHLECPAGYTGSFERRCNGNGEWEEIENNCVRITCPEESFEGVMWPATEGGATAVHSCGEDEEGGLTRVCRENGEWSSVVSGEGCYCQPTVVEACSTMYACTIRCTCSLDGSWTDLVSECERITCPGETMEGLFFPTTESDPTHVRRERRAPARRWRASARARRRWCTTATATCI